jgi:TolA-binding protein
MKPSLTLLFLLAMLSACSKRTDESVMNKAIEAHKLDSFDEAISSYQEVVTDFPESPLVPEALYALGNIYHDKKKDLKKSIEMFRKLVNSYPQHPTSSNAAFLIGFIYNNELKNYDSARVAYEGFIRMYPDNHLVKDAKFELETLGKDPAEIIKAHTEKSGRKQVAKKSQPDARRP